MIKICNMILLCILLLLFMDSQVLSQKHLVLVGGNLNDDNEQIYGKIIDLAGGVGSAIIGLITAANSEPEESAIFYENLFRIHGARDVYWIPVHENNKDANRDPEVVENIRNMTVFLFGGGEQIRIINSFYNNGRVESPALAAIKSTYESGAVVSGTSAGAACMNSAVMIIGGSSYEALLKGAFPLGNETEENDLTYEPEGGIGFINNVIVDVHFSDRGRQGRLIRLLSDTKHFPVPLGTTHGAGIDEDTALVISNVDSPDALAEVIGEGGVTFIDISKALADVESDNWGIVDVVTYYLTEGDTMLLATNEVTYSDWKSSVKGEEMFNKAVSSIDIFNGYRYNPLKTPEYINVTERLVHSKQSSTSYGVTSETSPRFKVLFIKDSTTEGYSGKNPRTGETDVSYSKMMVQIEEDLSECLTVNNGE